MFSEIRAGNRRGLAARVGGIEALRGKGEKVVGRGWEGMGGVFKLLVPGAPKQLEIKKNVYRPL